MLTVFKYWKVNTIVWNCIQIIIKCKIDARKWIVYSMSTLVNNLFISCWLCESVKCATICIGNIIIAPFWTFGIKISRKNRASRKFIVTWSIRVSTFVQKLVLILTRWSVETSTEAFFILHTNFSYQIVTLRTEIVSSNERNMFLIIDTYASISLTNRIVWS